MSENDKDLLAAIIVLAVGIYVCFTSLTMPAKGSWAESPGLFPGLLGLAIIALGAVLALSAKKHGGAISLTQFGRLIFSQFKSVQNRQIVLAVLFVGIYIFLGVPFLGYYLSSAIFVAVMLLLNVKRMHPLVSVATSAGTVLILFLIFRKLFLIPLK